MPDKISKDSIKAMLLKSKEESASEGLYDDMFLDTVERQKLRLEFLPATKRDICTLSKKLADMEQTVNSIYRMLYKIDKSNAPLCDTCTSGCKMFPACKDYKRKENDTKGHI